MTIDHLSENARALLAYSPEERIEFIQEDIWIGYPAATAILREMDDLINHPRIGRMPCRTIISQPDNGKSSLIVRCIKRNPNRFTEDEQSHLAVLQFETPSIADEGRLYSQILKSLKVAHREDAPPERLLAKIVDMFAMLRIRLLIADEFHNMNHGTPAHQRQFLASLKSLINMLKVAFVAVGISDVAAGLASDSQFITRFEHLELPKWGINQLTRDLIASLEQQMPLAEPSNLANIRSVAMAIMTAGNGTIGGISKIIKRSAIEAIRDGKEKITEDIVVAVIADLQKRMVSA